MAFDAVSHLGDALRLLFILDQAGQPIAGVPPVASAVALIEGQTRLSALHFWVRNPDHLAAALLYEHRAGRSDALAEAGRILAEREPELRRVPMMKYLRGAWESVDTPMGVLVTPRLAWQRKVITQPGRVRKHEYYLLAAGRALADRMVEEQPELDWYRRRAALVASIGPEQSARGLKNLQYREPEYAGAKLREDIRSIGDRVRRDYEAIIAGQAS